MTTTPVSSLVDDQLKDIQANSRPELIQALTTRGLFYVRDLPGHVKVVRQAKVLEMRR
jgi:hypothetical protein